MQLFEGPANVDLSSSLYPPTQVSDYHRILSPWNTSSPRHPTVLFPKLTFCMVGVEDDCQFQMFHSYPEQDQSFPYVHSIQNNLQIFQRLIFSAHFSTTVSVNGVLSLFILLKQSQIERIIDTAILTAENRRLEKWTMDNLFGHDNI